MIIGRSDKGQRLEEILDDIIEIVQIGSDCEVHDVSPETWLQAKAKLLELVALQNEQEPVVPVSVHEHDFDVKMTTWKKPGTTIMWCRRCGLSYMLSFRPSDNIWHWRQIGSPEPGDIMGVAPYEWRQPARDAI